MRNGKPLRPEQTSPPDFGIVPAQNPENEADRMQALHDYNILDTLPEQDFDDLTAIAAQICETPIALISLIDDDRQWFKSRVGFEPPELARDISFCPHAILEPDQVMVVPNALQDDRFKGNPLVTTEDTHVRFYAGAPLVTPDGYAIGTLCTLDQRPRQLSEQQLKTLQALSRQVMGQLELRAKNQALAAEIVQRTQAEQDLRDEQAKSERLLLNILPPAIAAQLKNKPELIAERYDNITIVFADLVNFTQFANQVSPQEVVTLLNDVFSRFDRFTDRFGLEKIKTIGDAYMAVAGLPQPVPNPAERAAHLALEMMREMQVMMSEYDNQLNLRIGMHAGEAIAGVIGAKKFLYDIWGDAVNTASRMESSGIPGRIQVSAALYEQLKDQFILEERGTIEVKGKGLMTTYFLCDRASPL